MLVRVMGYLVELDPMASVFIAWPKPEPEPPEALPDVDPLPAQIDFTAILESVDTQPGNVPPGGH